MKPIVASFEFVGTEETALEDSPEDFETYYLFRHHPPYHNDPFDGEVIAQSFEQTCELQTEPRRDSWRLIGLSQAAKADPCSC